MAGADSDCFATPWSPFSPLCAKADLALQGVAVADTSKARVDKTLRIERLGVVVPAVGSADAEAATERLLREAEFLAGNIDTGPVQELVVDVHDAIGMEPAGQAASILPRSFPVQREAQTTPQACAFVEVDRSAEYIRKPIEIDTRIHHLRPRRHGPDRIEGNPLSALQGKCIAECVVAADQNTICCDGAEV